MLSGKCRPIVSAAWIQQNPNLQINNFPSWFIHWLFLEQGNREYHARMMYDFMDILFTT